MKIFFFYHILLFNKRHNVILWGKYTMVILDFVSNADLHQSVFYKSYTITFRFTTILTINGFKVTLHLYEITMNYKVNTTFF